MIHKYYFLVPAIFFAFASSLSGQATPSIKADTIYIHANIYTGVAGSSSFHEIQRAPAMAVRGDRIMA